MTVMEDRVSQPRHDLMQSKQDRSCVELLSFTKSLDLTINERKLFCKIYILNVFTFIG